jgi:siroheme synthase (precorrin-2 oxidase/ferrochelatase)
MNKNEAAMRRLARDMSSMLPENRDEALQVIDLLREVLEFLMPAQPARRPCLSIISNTAEANPTGIELMSPR